MEITQLRLECLKLVFNMNIEAHCHYCLMDIANDLMYYITTGLVPMPTEEDEDNDEPKEHCALDN